MNEINISDISINFSQPGLEPPNKITTEYLIELCGKMDNQALYSAITGLCLAILALFYFGRIKPWLIHKELQGDLPTWFIPFMDKLLLTGIAMCFVVIIVRILRAG